MRSYDITYANLLVFPNMLSQELSRGGRFDVAPVSEAVENRGIRIGIDMLIYIFDPVFRYGQGAIVDGRNMVVRAVIGRNWT